MAAVVAWRSWPRTWWLLVLRRRRPRRRPSAAAVRARLQQVSCVNLNGGRRTMVLHQGAAGQLTESPLRHRRRQGAQLQAAGR